MFGSSTPHLPAFLQVMPTGPMDALCNQYGIRFGWMKAHECPCGYGAGLNGSPNPQCSACGGRGVYWDQPSLYFNGLLTYMHTSSAPDEPGSPVSGTDGLINRAEPTLTIPQGGPDNEAQVFKYASLRDAYVQMDAPMRFTATLVKGTNEILPYQQGIEVSAVTAYRAASKSVAPVDCSDYALKNGRVTLSSNYERGTAYVVEFFALPVFVAFRNAGGMPHIRPFGLGNSGIPRRFRLAWLDLWTRSRYPGDGPNGDTIQTPPDALLDDNGKPFFTKPFDGFLIQG